MERNDNCLYNAPIFELRAMPIESGRFDVYVSDIPYTIGTGRKRDDNVGAYKRITDQFKGEFDECYGTLQANLKIFTEANSVPEAINLVKHLRSAQAVPLTNLRVAKQIVAVARGFIRALHSTERCIDTHLMEMQAQIDQYPEYEQETVKNTLSSLGAKHISWLASACYQQRN